MKKIWIVTGFSLVVALAIVLIVTQTKKEPKEIRIGAILPLTGDVAMYGEVVKNAMDLAVVELNEEGGIKGKNLIITYEDSQAKPELATNAAKKLITLNNVPVIIGAMSSSEVLAIAPILNEKKVVLVSPAATSHDITKEGGYIFRTIVSDIYDGTAMARFAYNEKNIRTAGVFFITEAGPQGVAEAFIDEFKKLGGEIVEIEECHRGDTDFRTQLAKIHAKKPNAIYFALYPRETELFVRQVREMGLIEMLLTHQLMDDPEILAKLGNAADNIIFTTPKLTPETGDEAVKDFYKNYREKYGKDPQNFAPNAFDAVMLVAKAMEKYGFTSDAVRKALYEVKNYHGATGIFSIDKNGDVEQEMLIMVIREGKLQPYEIKH
jgi:branched-chain amino acid transport system substrate-binding protein